MYIDEGQKYVLVIFKAKLSNKYGIYHMFGSSECQCKVKDTCAVKYYFTYSKQCQIGNHYKSNI